MSSCSRRVCTQNTGLRIPIGLSRTRGSRRRLPAVAEGALERGAQPLVTGALLEHPRSQLEGWAVADMLGVPAFEMGDPVTLVITVKAHHRPFHF